MSLAIMKKHQHARLRARRTRARLHGSAQCPRLSIKRSLKHVYVQLINDDTGTTLACACDKDVSQKGKPLEVAKQVGELIGKKAQTLGITQAVFDRGAYRYHGRIAALAEGARGSGLTI
ncbi:50S ribosomal protein L18 [Candidatus Uhrbacteria bacterium]|nr:50S ribosomal protein L18 [Candidatus Uhrbacteria bacterium]